MSELIKLNGLYLKSHTEKIQNRFKNIFRNFFDIGFFLWEIEHYEYYKEDGFNTFSDYYNQVLGLKKSTVYNLISVCKKFSVNKDGFPTFILKDDFRDFSFSQLSEMVSIKNPNLLSSITPDMSVRQIKNFKKEFNTKEEVQTSGKINNDNVIDVDFKEEVETEKFQVQEEKVQTSGDAFKLKIVDVGFIDEVPLEDEVPVSKVNDKKMISISYDFYLEIKRTFELKVKFCEEQLKKSDNFNYEFRSVQLSYARKKLKKLLECDK